MFDPPMPFDHWLGVPATEAQVNLQSFWRHSPPSALTLPTTCNFWLGVVVPTPTLPVLVLLMLPLVFGVVHCARAASGRARHTTNNTRAQAGRANAPFDLRLVVVFILVSSIETVGGA